MPRPLSPAARTGSAPSHWRANPPVARGHPSDGPPTASCWNIRHDPGMDALDLVVGRAVADPEFRRQLLTEPVAALALANIPLPLKRRLTAIRARGIGDFALQALDAQAALRAGARA